MTLLRRAHAVAASIAGLLVLAHAADARLVVQRSLAGVKLGMTQEQVQAALGTPDEVNRPTHEIVGTYTELRYGLTYVSLFPGQDGEVFSVTTTSRKERTASGVGVGTTEKTLRRRVKGVRCESYGSFRFCTVGRAEPGRVVTDFRIGPRTHKVRRITLARVID